MNGARCSECGAILTCCPLPERDDGKHCSRCFMPFGPVPDRCCRTCADLDILIDDEPCSLCVDADYWRPNRMGTTTGPNAQERNSNA